MAQVTKAKKGKEDKEDKEKKRFWSDTLTQYTRENFGGSCPVYMKYGGDDKNYPFPAVGFGKDSLMLDKDLIPESERDKECFIFDYGNMQANGKPRFYKGYSSVDEMIDDGWAID